MGSIILNKNNPKQELKFNLEAPFIKITNIEIISLQPEREDDFARTIYANSIQAKVYLTETKTEIEYINFNDFNQLKKEFTEKKINIDRIVLDSPNANKLEFIINNLTQFEFELKVNYETFNQNINIINPSNNFKVHLDLNDNVKILFSAPFGQGKSTFLKYFFEQHEKEYEVFKVLPVNYSISHNDDVFKYIKTEILFQLLGKDVEFDKTNYSLLETLPSFIKKDPILIFAPLLKLIPKIGQNAYEAVQHLNKIVVDFLEYHKNIQENDQDKTESFIKEMYEKEGSIFEDNFFTQLIRQQLEKLKIKNNKKNVLIIEDLDRMDPEHIFRILNVFAAHFDAPEYLEGYTNKFGFDKIIIVADYENIKNIFSYRYGPNVEFDGYIKKYFSRKPFEFSNKNAIKEYIHNIGTKKNNNQEISSLHMLKVVLNDLSKFGKISLRDLLKLEKNDIKILISSDLSVLVNQSKIHFRYFPFFNLVYALTQIFDIDTLINKLELCITKRNFEDINYGYYTKLGLASLTEQFSKQESGNESIFFKDMTIQFRFNLNSSISNGNSYYEISNMIFHSKPDSRVIEYSFNANDFYEILLLNAKRFKEVGGFE
jgi:hypothetical protein